MFGLWGAWVWAEVFMQVTTPLSDALGRYLDLASEQMKLTAGKYGERRYAWLQDARV